MKRLLSLLMLLGMSVALIGCEASGRVGDDDGDRDGARLEVDVDN